MMMMMMMMVIMESKSCNITSVIVKYPRKHNILTIINIFIISLNILQQQ